MKPNDTYDVVIAGGGPAAMSAAILLGKCMRKVLLCDASHSELDLIQNPDRMSCCPSEFLRASRIQLNRLDTASSVRALVRDVSRDQAGFLITCDNGRSYSSRALLLASDFVARFPNIPGIRKFFGTSLHQCPYSDGWEHRGRIIGVIGNDDAAVSIALKLLIWTPRVTLYTHSGNLPKTAGLRLQGKPVEVVTGSVSALEGRGQQLESIRMENGSTYACDALFFSAVVRSHISLAAGVGCDLTQHARRNGHLSGWGTGIEGLFFIGEHQDGVEMAVSAAADGVNAAEAVNQWLMEAERSYLANPVQST